jgi:hypothetical protein
MGGGPGQIQLEVGQALVLGAQSHQSPAQFVAQGAAKGHKVLAGGN